MPRIKLAMELGRRAASTSSMSHDRLHFADIERLMAILDRLVDDGNSVVVIEHNLDVIARADWVIDVGPEGGNAGGRLIATGTPEQIAQAPESHTGRFLAQRGAAH
jgi:excinuclease ABC subunit A